MPQKQQYGNVYQQWHSELLYKYSKILDFLMDTLMSIPAYPDYITIYDKYKLILVSTSLGVKIDCDILILDNFYKILGKCVKTVDDKVEKLLKPEDTHKKLLESQINGEDIEDGDLSKL